MASAVDDALARSDARTQADWRGRGLSSPGRGGCDSAGLPSDPLFGYGEDDGPPGVQAVDRVLSMP
eukprot:5097518-Amphidinium_carterae.1